MSGKRKFNVDGQRKEKCIPRDDAIAWENDGGISKENDKLADDEFDFLLKECGLKRWQLEHYNCSAICGRRSWDDKSTTLNKCKAL